MANDKKDDVDINKIYGHLCKMPKEEFCTKFKIKEGGLSDEEITFRRQKYGLNEVTQTKPKKWYNYLFRSLFTPFNNILLAISCVLYYTDVYLAEDPNYANIIVILVLVTISTLLDFISSYRSNKAAEKLKQLVSTTATVVRNGKKEKVPFKDLVLGDTILLSAGDMVPADLRIIESKDLYVGQSSLTGESDAIKKLDTTELDFDTDIENLSDIDTICFMGTNIISGRAKGIVVLTADDTYFGKVSHTLTSGKPKTAFQKGIENISKLLIKFMLILIPIVFILTVQKHSIITSFTFAVAIAIGITPLLLPVILSSSLSKGALRMSKKKTIVKKLDSIQSFGAMNILCTDKTGTLTEDKIVLEKYLDINGNEDIRTLKHAFLNSYFQTGLKSNIDEAVINHINEHGLSELSEKYTKIDEIPFDFARRRLSVVVSDGQKTQMITKGAVEEILGISTMVDYQGNVSPITNAIKENIKKITKDLNKQGLRVVAVCQKNNLEKTSEFTVSDEKNMVLIGFIGFLDPPKESAKSSIEKLNKNGIRVIVLTGDNVEVTKCICDKVGIKSPQIVIGSQIDKLQDIAVKRLLKKTNIFAKLSPIQKARIVRLLRDSGNVVGYMGDGINDSPSLINSDVGISVDTAVDIAKESADIILLEKDLHVLLDGVKEGRHTYANLMKYIKLAASFNFGEVMSVIIASVILPFLPETPIQLIVEGLLYDFGQLTLPVDNVDEEYLKKPKKFDVKSLKNFMLFMGPLSSCFDLIVFALVWFTYDIHEPAIFQTIWFIYSIVSNLVGMHVIRTAKIPFKESHASKAVYFSSIAICIIAMIIPFTFIGRAIGLTALAAKDFLVIIGVPILYCFVAVIAKKIYIKKYGEWI